MTAPLPATAQQPGPLLVATRAGPKAPRAEAFTLPDVTPKIAAEETSELPAKAEAEASQPDPELIAIQFPVPPLPAAASQVLSAPQLTDPGAIARNASPASDAAPEAESPAQHAVPGVRPGNDHIALARAAKTDVAAASATPSREPVPRIQSDRPGKAVGHAAGTAPVVQAPIAQAPVAAPSARPPADSADQPPSRDKSGTPRPATQQRAGTESAPSLPPFRMEAVGHAPPGPVAAAVLETSPPPSALLAPAIPDLAAEAHMHTPDVVVELVGTDALDVTISAQTPESLDQLSAAEPELRFELARLGAEVEAIRMELRAEPGADKASPDRHENKGENREADATRTSQSGDNTRQGDRTMRQNELRETLEQGQLAAGIKLRVTGGPQGTAQDLAAKLLRESSGRIDRYA